MLRSNYVYKSIREGGRVRRTYLGTLGDPVVRALLQTERLWKATCDADQRQTEHELKIAEIMDQCLRLIHASANRAVRSLRKRWRRSNQESVLRIMMHKIPLPNDVYEALVADAANGDMEALNELKKLLKENPRLCHLLGDLNQHVRDHLVELAAAGAVDVKLSLQQMLADKQTELLSGGESPLERMLVDQVLSTMLDVAVCQMGKSQSHRKESTARRWELRLTAAQSRHHAAIKSLIEARQMLEFSINDGGFR